MAKFWFKLIIAGKRTIDDVPQLWRESVQMLLNEHSKSGQD